MSARRTSPGGRAGRPALRPGRASIRTPVLALAVAVTGCATITYEAALIEDVVAMNRVAPPASYERVGAFETDRRAVFLVAQLITVVDAELEDALRRELAETGGDAVINLRIHEEYDFLDVVIGAIGAGLVNTRKATLRGDIVRWAGDGTPESLLESSARCRPLEVPVPGGGTRAGLACVARGAAGP